MKTLFALATTFLGLAAIVTPAASQKGGGTAGTIYFSAQGMTNRMNADGSGKTALAAGLWGDPTRLLHGGRRWFVRIANMGTETYPDGSQRREVFAFPDDGSAPVQLSNDPALQPLHYNHKWAPGETSAGATVGGFARRWNDGATLPDPASVGLYTFQVAFDARGVPSAQTVPSFVVSAGLHYDAGSDVAWADVGYGWDFSSDMTRIVADHSDFNDLRVITLATGASKTVYVGNASAPVWSPNGARIAFHLYSPALPYGAIATVAPDGSGFKTNLKALAGTRVFSPSWSPDSAFLLYTKDTSGGWFVYDVYRVGASGGSQVNLTADLSYSASSVAWR